MEKNFEVSDDFFEVIQRIGILAENEEFDE